MVRICFMSVALHIVVTTPMNSFPLSERINSGTPCIANQLWQRASRTSAENFDRSGMKCTHRVHMHTAVSTYLYPFGRVVPGLYMSIAIARNGAGANIGVSGIDFGKREDFACVQRAQSLMNLRTALRKP